MMNERGSMRLPSNGRPSKVPSFRSRPLSFLRLAAQKRRRFPIFPLRKPARVYGKIGNLEVRLARSVADIKRAQRLRFEVFYKEMAAVADARTRLKKRDEDEYDVICDHLLVIDKTTEAHRMRQRLANGLNRYAFFPIRLFR
ncbi:MAG: GNAT family N-acyltransferase [Burkholderiaceae bacterium]